MTTTLNIETILPWSEPKRTSTRNGEKMLRTADPTEAFWQLWRANKQALKDAGLSCAPYPGDARRWHVCWWQDIDPIKAAKERADREAASAASRATDAAIEVPKPDGLEFLPYQKAGVAFILRCWQEDSCR